MMQFVLEVRLETFILAIGIGFQMSDYRATTIISSFAYEKKSQLN